ncbi:MAG TPA: biotin--[acetyl-CoA-carboxylase] ligase, partial [Advenella kashmirensis]|nr:biotin--[acetyl-CoA-carboxylase] ligase [Advenella kashmirensis]
MSLLPSASVLQKTLYSALPDFASIAWVEQVGSTNVNLMQEVRGTQSAMGRPALLGAHTQTSGRGRAGRR